MVRSTGVSAFHRPPPGSRGHPAHGHVQVLVELDGLIDLLENLPLELVPLLPELLELSGGNLSDMLQIELMSLYLQTIERGLALQAQAEPAPQPPKRVAMLPHRISHEECQEGIECSVCLSQFEFGEEGVVQLKCGHLFHRNCLEPWFVAHHTCPVCRADIDEGPSSE
jgi:hypothetical protein